MVEIAGAREKSPLTPTLERGTNVFTKVPAIPNTAIVPLHLEDPPAHWLRPS
jgi:hypothetical protein